MCYQWDDRECGVPSEARQSMSELSVGRQGVRVRSVERQGVSVLWPSYVMLLLKYRLRIYLFRNIC